jgi:hypothetical protein
MTGTDDRTQLINLSVTIKMHAEELGIPHTRISPEEIIDSMTEEIERLRAVEKDLRSKLDRIALWRYDWFPPKDAQRPRHVQRLDDVLDLEDKNLTDLVELRYRERHPEFKPSDLKAGELVEPRLGQLLGVDGSASVGRITEVRENGASISVLWNTETSITQNVLSGQVQRLNLQ